MTMTKKTIDRRVTVSGIRYWTHWTITANLDIEFGDFVKSANNRAKSRILLNNFAEIVAQDIKF